MVMYMSSTRAMLSDATSDLVDTSMDQALEEQQQQQQHDENASHHSLPDFQQVLMEAGYASTDALVHPSAELTKNRERTSSSCSGVSSAVVDSSLMTATAQRDRPMGDASCAEDDSSLFEADGSCSDHFYNEDVAMQSTSTSTSTCAPEHVAGRVHDSCCAGNRVVETDRDSDGDDQGPLHKKLPAVQRQPPEPLEESSCSHPPVGELQMDQHEMVVVPLSSLQFLKAKRAESTTVPVEENNMDAMTTSTDAADGGDQESISSTQSIVSAVAELVTYPIKVFAAVMADLNTELFASMKVPSRAEFISATLVKEIIGDNHSFGMRLERKVTQISVNEVLVIADIDPQGHWGQSPLQVGDRIVSINHTNVSQWQVEEIHQLWTTLLVSPETEAVTIVAHNPTGEGKWVSSMITKPDPSARTGLGMRSNRPGRVKISRVTGLFCDSLLNPGDQILSINGLGVHGYHSSDTADVILQSPRYVTVLAKADSQCAFVIATNGGQQDTSAVANTPLLGHSSTGAQTTAQSDAMERGEGGGTPGPIADSDNDGRRGVWAHVRGPWTTLKVLLWSGSVYVAFVTVSGIFICVHNRLHMGMVVGVLALSIVLLSMVVMTARSWKQQQLTKAWEQRCSTYQMSFNVILLCVFTFLILIWDSLDKTSLSSELAVVLVLAPMFLVVNMPRCCNIAADSVIFSCCNSPVETAVPSADDNQELVEDGGETAEQEPEAVASFDSHHHANTV